MLRLLLIFTIITCVSSKNYVKSLTESMGQEVIEIGPQLKELPPGLEEEPSAENDQDDKTTTTIQPATKRDVKKTTISTTQKKAGKTQEVIQEDEESKIEKELAEMYKDNADYKGDSSEVSNQITTVDPEDKPALRQRNFKFQPDLNNRNDIERFRTSVDEISCDRRVTKLSGEVQSFNTASTIGVSSFAFILSLAFIYC